VDAQTTFTLEIAVGIRNFSRKTASNLQRGKYQDLIRGSLDSLFETNVAHQYRYIDKPSTFPSDRCRANADYYSKMTLAANHHGYDYSVYINVITEFYLKHPEYRNIQLVILMHHLTDQQFKGADDLYTMAKHGDIGPI
jgi:hypothetical protein